MTEKLDAALCSLAEYRNNPISEKAKVLCDKLLEVIADHIECAIKEGTPREDLDTVILGEYSLCNIVTGNSNYPRLIYDPVFLEYVNRVVESRGVVVSVVMTLEEPTGLRVDFKKERPWLFSWFWK